MVPVHYYAYTVFNMTKSTCQAQVPLCVYIMIIRKHTVAGEAIYV